jgi:uncharacterized cofD-like protein
MPANQQGPGTSPGASPLRVVAIGGGTGLSAILRGLKHFTARPAATPTAFADTRPCISELSAIVTVSDDGGSSGRLRKELNMPPPGDIRNCLVALSEDEALLSRLFQHRFSKGSELEGHSFGNLFLAALTAVTGDFTDAVQQSSEILASRGRIFPATTSHIELEAEMADGTHVRGETNITASSGRIVRLVLVPADVEPLPQTLEAIAQADLITMGPGSLFTSLIPNLLVRGIPEAIVTSPAIKVYICNLMTQANESLGLTAADHIHALHEHAEMRIFDFALINRKSVTNAVRARYALEGATQIVADLDAVRSLGVQPILGDYLVDDDKARHATDQVAHDLIHLTQIARVQGKANVAPAGFGAGS